MSRLIAAHVRRLVATIVLAALVFGSSPAAAATGARFALLVEGASGGPPYDTLHRQWLDGYVTLFRTKFKYDASHLLVLAETPGTGEEKSTADGLRAAVGKLAAATAPDDEVVIILIGHGGGEGSDAKFNLVGPDLSVAEWAKLVQPVKGHLAFIDTTSASFPYLAGMAAPGRVVITATASAAQTYHTVFADAFVRALASDEADADKDGRISLLEAFTYASRLVKDHYTQAGTMATEVAMIDDDGDGKGRNATTTGADGTIAAVTYLETPSVATSADPETQRLLTRQQALTDQIDELRRKKGALSEADFNTQMDALVTELAQVSRDIRQKTGTGTGQGAEGRGQR